MRIAQVMAGAPVGGAELFFERLCIALHRAGDEILPVIRSDAARTARLRAAGLQPAELAFGGPLDMLTRPRLAKLLQAWSPRVVVSWMSRATHHVPHGPWVHVGRLGGYYNLSYYRGCDHLVGNTHGIVAWLRAHDWPEGRTHFLPNFVEDFASTPPASGLKPKPPLLLAMGRLHQDKGFDVLIRALRHIPRAHLLIAGEGPERAALLKLAYHEHAGARVSFLGWRQDAGALLKAADVFVCPSRREPLGNVVIEAWSAARPVVAASVDGPRELIADGVNGLLVPPEEPEPLAVAINALLGDTVRAQALAAAGRHSFARDFAEQPVVARWRTFLSTVQPRSRACAELPDS